MGKEMSAHQLHARMRLDSKNIEIKHDIKEVVYRGYVIKIMPLLVPGGKPTCIIGKLDTGIAHRAGLDHAQAWIDEYLCDHPEEEVRRIKVKVK